MLAFLTGSAEPEEASGTARPGEWQISGGRWLFQGGAATDHDAPLMADAPPSSTLGTWQVARGRWQFKNEEKIIDPVDNKASAPKPQSKASKDKEMLEDLLENSQPVTSPKAVSMASAPADAPRAAIVPPARRTVSEPTEVKVSALMQPEPPTAADRAALRRPVSMETSSPSKDSSRNSTAPASPVKSQPPVPHGGSRAGGAAQAADAEPRRGLPGFLGKSSQTPNYQPLSTNEYNPTGMAANSAIDSSDSVPPPPWNKLYPSPTPRNMAGASRIKLREAFNLKEIDVQSIFDAYDVDKSNQLDQKELRKLLKAFIDRKGPIKDDEVRFVLAVADKDRDDCISKREVLFGLQAWYAFTAMPPEVNAALKKYRITADGSRMSSPDELRSLLTDLNGFIDVDPEDGTSVRRAAIAVGASENKATSEQMRKAIATWYINIERSETGFNDLATHSALRMGDSLRRQSSRFFKTMSMVKGQDVEQGGEPLLESDGEEFVDLRFGLFGTWGPLLGWLVLCVLPGLYMVHVSGWYPTPVQCEHDLAYLVKTKGYLCMLMGFSGLFNNVMHESRCASGVQLAGLVALVIFIIQDLAGIGLVLNSSPAKCGAYLSSVSQLFFVWSIFWFPALLCCCMSCFCLTGVFLRMLVNKSIDDSLHPSRHPGARPPPSTRE